MTEVGWSSTTAAPRPGNDPRGNGHAAPRPAGVDRYDVEPLGESYRRFRWIKPVDVEWARRCDRIMLEYGAIRGQLVYDSHREARGRALRLIRLWADLGLRSRSEVHAHVNRVEGGWAWAIQLARPGS
jgi:hypothetical protein